MLITPSIATSTDTERTFSRGHLTVSRLRHSLGEDSVCAGTVVGSWAGIPAILREDNLANIIKAGPAAAARKQAANDTEACTAEAGNVIKLDQLRWPRHCVSLDSVLSDCTMYQGNLYVFRSRLIVGIMCFGTVCLRASSDK